MLPGTDTIFSTSKTWKMMICVVQVGNNAGKNKIPNLTIRLYFNFLFSLEPLQWWLVTKTKNCNFMNHSSGSVFLFFFSLHSNSVSFREAAFWFDDHLSEVATAFLYMFLKKIFYQNPVLMMMKPRSSPRQGKTAPTLSLFAWACYLCAPPFCAACLKKKRRRKKRGKKNWRSMCL